MGIFKGLFGRKDKRDAAETKAATLVENDDDTLPLPPAKVSAAPLEEPPPPTAPLLPVVTRPLEAPRSFAGGAAQRISFGMSSDVGQVRTNNQDACMAFVVIAEMTGTPPPMGFFVVADGMGGHHDGEMASAVTVQTLAQHVMSDIFAPQIEGRTQSSEAKTIPEALAEAMDAANRAVQLQVPNGGTTATAVVLRGDLAFIAHVGDSRAYLYIDGGLDLVTRDHSLVRRLQELGQLTPEEAEVHPQRNVLYRAIGQGETLEVDPATRRMPPASRLLLCSDGLWGVIGDDGIARILGETPDPQEACDKLVMAANAAGGHDNITAVLIQMPS